MGAAFAVPTSFVRSRTIRDQDAPVLGAAVLEFGLGGMNIAALIWFVIGDEISASAIGYGVLPLVAAALGLRAVLRKLDGMQRFAHLFAAAALTLLGFPGYFAPLVAALATGITAFLYLAGLVRDPRTLLRNLDPRN